mmetsp:Transcript_12225/g.22195  ORF Transcript_12225/g.22195 Transcript_12225/m.22195 type:complete len:421 (+) Transcript_12225:99-1361(+)
MSRAQEKALRSQKDSSEEEPCFVQLLPEKCVVERLPDRIDVYVSRVLEPKQCGPLIKALDALMPLRPRNSDSDSKGQICQQLAHLRRVRRAPFSQQISTTDESSSIGPRENKRKRTSEERHNPNGEMKTILQPIHNKGVTRLLLEVVLGSVSHVCENVLPDTLERLISTYNLDLSVESVPGRPAESKEELEEWNQIWPTLYFHKQTKEHDLENQTLTTTEIAMMECGMQAAIMDAQRAREQWRQQKKEAIPPYLPGTVVMNPETEVIVSRASEERENQIQSTTQQQSPGRSISSCPDIVNPLSTSVMMAIQGVSRLERQAATGHGMDSAAFRNGQYLCTGYDVYTTQEPGVFEAMGLVHSRIRRIIFGVPDHQCGGLGGTGSETAVHCLPGTNHHYRAYQCNSTSSAWNICRALHPMPNE